MVTNISPRILRINFTAFVTDFALYLIWTAIPYKAIDLDATPAILGVLPAISASTYVVLTFFAGRLSDRVSRLNLARIGALIFAVGCLLIWRVQSIAEMLPILPLMGLGMALFWPPIQAAVADEANLRALEKNIGLFNVFWSSGKAFGFLVGGSLYNMFGGGPIFLLGAGVMVLMTFVIPRTKPAPVEDEDGGDYTAVSRRDLFAFLRMAWVANAIAFGVGNTMNTQFPKFLLEELNLHSQWFGIYLFTIFMMQTLTFYLLRTVRRWRFRRLPAYTVQILMGLAVLSVPFLGRFGLVVLTAVPLGLGLGLGYHASITYSLASRSGRGRRAGIHEGLLGAGNLLLPLCGGLLASATGDLKMPYLLCAAVVGAGLLAQELIWKTRRPERT